MSSRVDLGAMPAAGVGLCVAALLAACSGTGSDNSPRSLSSNRPAPTLNRPLFTEDAYGVSTSPRIAGHLGPTRKGGGSFKLGSPYKVAGRWYVPREEPGYDRRGTGSWYGDDFHGRKTANGEIFDMHALTAAHPTLPLPSYAYVTNVATGRTIMVRVNDRGPYVSDRIIDLSHASARALGYENQGHAPVRVRYAGRAPLNGDDRRERQYLASQPWSRGGPAVASYAPPNAPIDVPEPFPAGTAGRWSPTAYRSALAGKPIAPSPVRSGAQRFAALPQRTGSTDAVYATMQDAGGQDAGGLTRGLAWRASPPSRPATAYVQERQSGGHNGLGAPADAVFAENAAQTGSVYVQVGTFRDQANAERMRRTLGHIGPVEVAPAAASGGASYRVRIGPMTPANARSAQAEVTAQGVTGSRIVQD